MLHGKPVGHMVVGLMALSQKLFLQELLKILVEVIVLYILRNKDYL